MKKNSLLFFLCFLVLSGSAQELFVSTEPASNMPAHSISAIFSAAFGKNTQRFQQRYAPELMFGFSKKFMLMAGASFSNMQTSKINWESFYLYGKYRFLSLDAVHQHFRMAAFMEVSHSNNQYQFQEVNIQNRSGLSLGVIATKLISKCAVSATAANVQAMDPSRRDKIFYTPERIYQAMNYSLSAGILLLPAKQTSYQQLNINLYTELLMQKTIEQHLHYVDLAPAIQFIFNSNSKLSFAYRFQLNGNETRVMDKSFRVSFDHSFLNAMKKQR